MAKETKNSLSLTPEQNALFEKYLPCVTSLINHKEYYNFRNIVPVDDMEVEGMIGLCKACKTYKAEYCIKFTTYAYRCIENEIITLIRKERNHNTKGNNISYDKILENTSEAAYGLADETFIESAIFSAEVREAIAKIFEKTNSKCLSIGYQALLAKVLDSKNDEQLSEQFGISPATVRNYIHRTRLYMKSNLEAQEFFDRTERKGDF